MLKRGCLLQDPATVNSIKDLARIARNNLQAAGKNPTFIEVFDAIQESGAEIDIQTVGDIYKDVFPTNDKGYTKAADVDKLTQATTEAIINYVIPTPVTQSIKGDSPEVNVVKSVFNRFKVPGSPRLMTAQKQIEDKVRKWAIDQLGLKGQKTTAKTADQALAELIHVTRQQAISVGGTQQVLKTANTLQQEVLDVLSSMLPAQLVNINRGDYDSQLIVDAINQLASIPVKLAYSSTDFKLTKDTALKRAGYAKTINQQSGPKEVVDWNKVAREVPSFSTIVAQAFPQFGAAEQAMIVDSMDNDFKNFINKKREDILRSKNLLATTPKTTQQRSAMDRFYELYELGIFQSAQQDALLKVIGVTEADAMFIRSLEEFARLTHMANETHISKWTPSFNKGNQIALELMLERAEERGNPWIKFLRYLGYWIQLGTASLITRPQNMVENTSTGTLHLFYTWLNNPRAAKKAISTFFTVYKDTVQGGVRVGEDYSNTYDSKSELSSRASKKLAARTWQGKVAQNIDTAMRYALQGFDNGFKAAMMEIHIAKVGSEFIRKQNPHLKKGEEYTILNEVLYGNNTELAHIIDQMAAHRGAIGWKVSQAEKQRWMGEYALSNLISGGDIFTQTIDRLVASGNLSTKNVSGIPEDILLMIRTGANSTAAKALGHEGEGILKYVTDWNRGATEAMARARQSRNKWKIGTAMVRQMSTHIFYKFMGAGFRWMWLTGSRSSFFPLPFMVGYDALISLRDRYANGDKSLGWIERIKTGTWENTSGLAGWNVKNVNPEKIFDPEVQQELLTNHMSIRDRYARMAVGNITGFLVGYFVIMPALASMYEDIFPDDDEELTEAEKLAKIGVWIQEDRTRRSWFLKMMPMAIWDYIQRITRTDQTTGFRPQAREEPEELTVGDYFDYEVSMNMMLRVAPEMPIWTEISEAKAQQSKQNPRTGQVVIEGLTNILNPLGPLKIPVNWMDAFGIGETGQRTDWQRQALKADGWLDAAWRGSLGVSSYAALANKDHTEIAPVDQYVKDLYKETGDMAFLPPMVFADIEEDGWEMRFTPEMEDEWLELVKSKLREESTNAVPWVQQILGGIGTPAEKKKEVIEELRDAYKTARESAKEEFLEKYPMETYGRAKPE